MCKSFIASEQASQVCVAYDLVATQGGVTLMLELLVPTERWPVLTAGSRDADFRRVGMRKVSLTNVECMAG